MTKKSVYLPKNNAKDFDSWNILKKSLDKRNVTVFCHKKEVWWCSLGLNIGFEENGKNINFERPVLILKKFNKNMFWVLPMTSRTKENRYYYKIWYRNKYFSVILSQLRLISDKRLLRKIWLINPDDFSKIKQLTKNLL